MNVVPSKYFQLNYCAQFPNLNNNMNNKIYLQRRNKVIYNPQNKSVDSDNNQMISTILKNFENLGYTLSETLINSLNNSSEKDIERFYFELLPILKSLKNVDKHWRPMYQNFPQEVMDKSNCELYFNAIIHYLTDGQLMPVSEKKERFPLLDNVNLTVIDLGNEKEFLNIFSQIAGSNTSLSIQDKEDLEWYVKNLKNNIIPLLPTSIPQKENLCYIAGLLLDNVTDPTLLIRNYISSATDVLRFAVVMSNGDVSLSKPSKFRNFNRKERRFLVGLLDGKNITEDLIRWKNRWIKLAHQLHVGEYSKQYPNVVKAFSVIRNNETYSTFNSRVEKALLEHNSVEAVRNLAKRPGDFARRLDHLLRISDDQNTIVNEFSVAAINVSTPVLLQVLKHFETRNHVSNRYFMPKGDIAKIKTIPNNLNKIDSKITNDITKICRMALMNRFENLPNLGKVYLDKQLSNYIIPFSQRSASKSLRTLTRGSKLDFDSLTKTLRFFLWWKNGNSRTDIDLSAQLLDSNYNYVNNVSYFNLKGQGFAHSGDIVDAPKGAAEYIDIDLDIVRKNGIRYVVMMVNSFSQQPYCDLPECFAGFMPRQKSKSGEIFEPKTVFNRIDLTSDSKQVMPMIIDIVDNKVIWCDLSIKNSSWANNIDSNSKSINMMVKSIIEMQKTDLYSLLELHALSRGTLVSDKNNADTIFDEQSEIQYQLERIGSEFLI